MVELSVIIVNYNVKEFLENALIAIRKAISSLTASKPGIEGEIFVVDNASDDGSVELVQSKFPDVHLIVNKENLGFAKANNLALKRSRGKYILLINPDTVVQEDTFRAMIDFFERNPDVGMAGCKILNPDGTLQLNSRRSFPTPWVAFSKMMGLSALFPHTKLFGQYNLTYLSPDESYEVDALSGSFMMFRREVYEQIGGLDEDFFMYGEDLDWCYRVQQAGWKNYYVPATQIIHYKGESTKRSNLDEIRTFYQAMHLFVRKHFNKSFLVELLLRIGIVLRTGVAFVGKVVRVLLVALVDWFLINIAILLGEYLWFGEVFHFPQYAYPIVFIVPALIFILTLYFAGVYTYRKFSVSRTLISVVIGFFLVSSLTYFFKAYAFSRAVVLISSAINVMILPGWRLMLRLLGRGRIGGRKSLFGRKTLIVGTGKSGQEVLRKLRARVADGYDVVGFIDINRQRLGEQIYGVKILGSIDNVGKVIRENKVSEVIFSTDMLSYTDILSVISRSRERAVNFRLVPSSLEVIIGKTSIDQLGDIPFIEIDYNLDKLSNRIVKRTFDIFFSLFLLISVYPFIYLKRVIHQRPISEIAQKILLLPQVLKGDLSLVGRQPDVVSTASDGNAKLYLGKVGLTGLVQIDTRDDLTAEEIEKYNIYYAKNQSLLLDIEILLKSLSLMLKKKGI